MLHRFAVCLPVFLALGLISPASCQDNTENATDAISYIGSHKKLAESLVLEIGIGELNRAYGYLEIDGVRDSIDRGGENLIESLEGQFTYDSGRMSFVLKSGAYGTIEGFRSAKIKVTYTNIIRFGTKPIRLKLKQSHE